MNDLIFVRGCLETYAQLRLVAAGGGSSDCDSTDDRVDGAGLHAGCHSGTSNARVQNCNLQWYVAFLVWEVRPPSP